jgi:hypothetical protein
MSRTCRHISESDQSKGGKTNAANCQMLCLEDNRRKSAI